MGAWRTLRHRLEEAIPAGVEVTLREPPVAREPVGGLPARPPARAGQDRARRARSPSRGVGICAPVAVAARGRLPWRRMVSHRGLAVTDVGAGPPVLLVHGQPGSRADWRRLVPLLADDHRVLSVDRPGYGDSGGEAVGMIENAELLWQLLEERSAVGATVVGHSLGAGIALAMAERSLGVGALVLVGTAGVQGTVGALDHLLALRFASTLGISGVRRVVRMLGRHAAGPVAAAIDGWGPTSGRSFTREQRALLRERDLLEDGARPHRRADDRRRRNPRPRREPEGAACARRAHRRCAADRAAGQGASDPPPRARPAGRDRARSVVSRHRVAQRAQPLATGTTADPNVPSSPVTRRACPPARVGTSSHWSASPQPTRTVRPSGDGDRP